MITLNYFGRIKHEGLKQMADYYIKTSSKYTDVRLVSMKEHNGSNETEKKKKENEALIRRLEKENSVKILLDVKGRELTTEEFAEMLGDYKDRGERIAIYIGNYYGVDKKIRDMFDLSISLSRLTFNHEIALMLITEQIYRGMNYLSGGKYHK